MLVFVDESGQPYPNDMSPFSVLAGIALKEELSRDLSRELFNLKKIFKGIRDPMDWELKGRELLSSTYIPPTTREFMKEVFALCRLYEVMTFASIMQRPTEDILTPEENPYIHNLYKFLLRRIDCCIRENCPDQRAVLLFDAKDGRSNERLAKRFTDFLYKSREGQECGHILDTPFFANSEMTPGIQIADLFAYIINKRFQRKRIRFIDEYYAEIKRMQFEWEDEETGKTLYGIKFIEERPKGKESEETKEEG